MIYNIWLRRFPCSFVFWVKLLAIYFTANGPQNLIDGSISTMFSYKEQKEEWEKRLQNRSSPVNFAEFLRTPFLNNTAASEDKHDKTKLSNQTS